MTRRCKSGGNIKEGKGQSKRNQPNRIMLVERDIIRHLIIPRENGERPATTFISESHFDRIKQNSQVRIVMRTYSNKISIKTEENKMQNVVMKAFLFIAYSFQFN